MNAPTSLPPALNFLPAGNITATTVATIHTEATGIAYNKTIFVDVAADAVKVITKNDYKYALYGFCKAVVTDQNHVIDFTLFNASAGTIYLARMTNSSVTNCRKLTGTAI